MTVHPFVIAREQDGECAAAERSDINPTEVLSMDFLVATDKTPMNSLSGTRRRLTAPLLCWLMIGIGYPALGLAESPLQDHPTPLTADTKLS